MAYYQPLELGIAGKPTCPDQYEPKSETTCAGARKLTIQINNNAVYIQFGRGIGGIEWSTEEPYLPVVGGLVRQFDAVRVRNLTAGKAAQVLLTPLA